ncbi:hypothetical protein BpHYR1_048565 [Brachionus plicatilis]|uniref:Uncharacterized protein n=1 Tax=Brachionus plicatilis TaxID=10195 RepID=A0A3M7PF59_BRAPC|nr:hypothetical protein BpHYR1_048565 [Brachionus plicatilis]
MFCSKRISVNLCHLPVGIIKRFPIKTSIKWSFACFAFAGLPGFLFSPIGIFFADNVRKEKIMQKNDYG